MALTLFAKFFAKTFIKNPSMWFWSVFFILFWLTMGAFVFSRGFTKESIVKSLESTDPTFRTLPEEYRPTVIEAVWKRVTTSYTASWLAVCVVLSFSSTAMGFVGVIFNSVLPIRFLSKYSKANEVKVLLGYIAGSLVVLVIQFVVLLFSSIAMFSYRFNAKILPENPFGLFVTTIALVLFVFLFSLTLSLLVIVIRKPRFLSMMTPVPLVVSYALSMLQIYVGGEAINFSPFNASISLLYYYYSNIEPPYSEPIVLGYRDVKTVKPLFAWGILAIWITMMFITSVILLKKQKGVSAEELRVM